MSNSKQNKSKFIPTLEFEECVAFKITQLKLKYLQSPTEIFFQFVYIFNIYTIQFLKNLLFSIWLETPKVCQHY